MTPSEPKIPDNNRYGVTEAAKILAVDRKTLRKYADSGLIKHGIQRANGRKFFYGSELKRIWRATL